jgi:hypothetical protein
MNPIMPYGLLTKEKQKNMSSFNKRYKNSPLRMGCIIKSYDIDDEQNSTNIENAAVPQYTVIVEQQQGSGTNFVTYDRCICMTSFGGLADFFEYKLRDSTVEFTESYDYKKQNGSMVLLLCIDGFSEKGIIIGSVKHYERPTKLTGKTGLHLEGEYNGLNWKINKEGELIVTFKSKTDNDGKPQDETAGGTHFQIDKKGSIDINTNLEGDEETYIRMDKAKKDIGLKSGNKVGVTAKNNIAFKSDASIKGTAKSIEFKAEGAANYSAKSSISIEGKSAVNVKGGNVSIEGENGVIIKGKQTLIDSQLIQLGNGGSGAVIATTKFIGIGNMGAPVQCSAVGPFSKTVIIAP